MPGYALFLVTENIERLGYAGVEESVLGWIAVADFEVVTVKLITPRTPQNMYCVIAPPLAVISTAWTVLYAVAARMLMLNKNFFTFNPLIPFAIVEPGCHYFDTLLTGYCRFRTKFYISLNIKDLYKTKAV